MNYLILHKNNRDDLSCNIQHVIKTGGSVAGVLLYEISRAYRSFVSERAFTLAVPDGLPNDGFQADFPIITCSESLSINPGPVQKDKADRWVLLSNGRYVTQVDPQWLTEILLEIDADVTCVNVDPELTAFREKIRLSSQGDLIGIRRHYDNSARMMATPEDWPPHVFIKINTFNKLNVAHTLPLNFTAFIARCRQASLNIHSVSVAGTMQDLDTEPGLLAFVANTLNSNGEYPASNNGHVRGYQLLKQTNCPGRLFGQVIAGRDVHIEPGAIVVGPTLLDDHVKIGKDAIVRSAIIGANVTIPEGYRLENRIAMGPGALNGHPVQSAGRRVNYYPHSNGSKGRQRFYFRTWPWLSYGGIFKRLADIVFSLLVLLFSLPALPILAVIIKITDPGPIFFGHGRQGRYGKKFKCIKFRTMMVGADDIQGRLRIKNQVDGPQFKMEDDPRVTRVGKFLRDTCIDEIPQFINVLLGQMSVVGPRPSPENENAFCAYWRDARLSVRPGITGMWQVCRTRDEGQDFQEWVSNDTNYVKRLSPGLDLWICWKTVIQLAHGLMRKF